MKIAMKQVKQWYENGLNPGKLALNMAVVQLHKHDFLSSLKDIIQETGFRPEWLALEVTEGQIMSNPENAIAILQKISDMGIELPADELQVILKEGF